MSFDLIALQETHEGQVSEIVLGPAPGNILSEAAMAEITEAIRQSRQIAHKKLLVFRGAGKNFCFGASVEEHLPERVGGMLPKFHRFIAEILACEIPTLARLGGHCLGGGFELALACNFLFAERSAKLGVPEIQLGVFPPAACVLLPLRGGDAIASQLILTGETFLAPALFERGLINTLAEDGELDAVLEQFITRSILPKSASSLRLANRATRLRTVATYEQYIGQLETLYLQDLMATTDAALGINCFLEKKTPAWVHA